MQRIRRRQNKNRSTYTMRTIQPCNGKCESKQCITQIPKRGAVIALGSFTPRITFARICSGSLVNLILSKGNLYANIVLLSYLSKHSMIHLRELCVFPLHTSTKLIRRRRLNSWDSVKSIWMICRRTLEGGMKRTEDYSRVEEDNRKYEEFIKSLRRAADYAEKEMNQS